MKEFDLKAALNGEPVKLRNGNKAYVLARLPDNLKYAHIEKVHYPLIGVVMDEDGYVTDTHMSWTIGGGCYVTNEPLKSDIIGMWEEPKISIEDLPKPFKPKNGESYYYICGKAIEHVCSYAEVSHFDRHSAQNGQCYRTREDAQKWLDFMKSMIE